MNECEGFKIQSECNGTPVNGRPEQRSKHSLYYTKHKRRLAMTNGRYAAYAVNPARLCLCELIKIMHRLDAFSSFLTVDVSLVSTQH